MRKIPRISVIVPVYNAKRTLGECIESVLQQTYRDIELILVDDGSADESGEICDTYAKKDRRIKVIHKENGGVSSARNMGIEKAEGEYICFIDSDDYIEAETLATAEKSISDTNPDLFIWGMVYDYFGKEGLIKSVNAPDNKALAFEKADINLWMKAFSEINMASPCNKLYKKSLVKKNHVQFDTACVFYEDLKFNLDYCRHVQSVVSIENGLYHYRQTDIPQISKRKFGRIFINSDKVYDSLAPYINETKCKKTIFDNIAAQTYYQEMCAHVRQKKDTAEVMKALFANPRYKCILKRIKKGKKISTLWMLCRIRAYKIAGFVAKKICK